MVSVAGHPDGHLEIAFADGATVYVDGRRLVNPGATAARWENVYLGKSGLDLILPTKRGHHVVIPWDVVRSLTDKDFAAYMARVAEEHARVIGKRLRDLRQRRGLQANELAERAGITPQSLYRIEQGKHGVVLTTLGKILAAMGYSYRDLAAADGEDGEDSD